MAQFVEEWRDERVELYDLFGDDAGGEIDDTGTEFCEFCFSPVETIWRVNLLIIILCFLIVPAYIAKKNILEKLSSVWLLFVDRCVD